MSEAVIGNRSNRYFDTSEADTVGIWPKLRSCVAPEVEPLHANKSGVCGSDKEGKYAVAIAA